MHRCILSMTFILLSFTCATAQSAEPTHAVAGATPKWSAAEVAKLRSSGQRVPEYMLQHWPAPKRTLVWAKPGESGLLNEPGNWLHDGKPLESMELAKDSGPNTGLNFDADTDLVLPKSDKPYTVGFSDRAKGGIRARHVTIEAGAFLKPAQLEVYGNLWAQPNGRVHVRYSLIFLGDRHAFFHNDKPAVVNKTLNALAGGAPNATFMDDNGYMTAQYLFSRKADNKSVEYIGTIVTSDDFQPALGVTIVAPKSQLFPGTRSTQIIPKNGVLRLLSGSEFGKVGTAPWYDHDLIIRGRLEAGTSEAPLTEDAILGISFKDRAAFTYKKGTVDTMRSAPGLAIDGGTIEVISKDPKSARLIVGWHGRENTWYQANNRQGNNATPYKDIPKQIDIEIRTPVKLDGVTLRDVAPGGIRLKSGVERGALGDVNFAQQNQLDELFAKSSND